MDYAGFSWGLCWLGYRNDSTAEVGTGKRYPPRTLDKFVEVKAICIRSPRILYTGYLEAFGRHRGKPLDPLHADAF